METDIEITSPVEKLFFTGSDKAALLRVSKSVMLWLSIEVEDVYKRQRVFSAPIAEDYIVGTANGMSRFDPKIHVSYTHLITAVVNILKRLILPGPVVYDALPKEVSGTIAPVDAFTKNRLILSLCSR